MPFYEDLADQPEDERIQRIGEEVMKRGRVCAVCVDDEPDKPERYIRKLTAKFPGLQVLDRFPGPVPGVVTINVGPISG